MKICDLKVGDKVRISVNAMNEHCNGVFNGYTVKAPVEGTIISMTGRPDYSHFVVIGWEEKTKRQDISCLLEPPSLPKLQPSVAHFQQGIHLNRETECDKLISTKASSANPMPFLLACIGLGSIVSALSVSNINNQSKENLNVQS